MKKPITTLPCMYCQKRIPVKRFHAHAVKCGRKPRGKDRAND